jgi:hypothetical protein
LAYRQMPRFSGAANGVWARHFTYPRDVGQNIKPQKYKTTMIINNFSN